MKTVSRSLFKIVLLITTPIGAYCQGPPSVPVPVRSAIGILEKGLKAKDFDLVKGSLDEKFTYKDMPQPMAGMIMQQVVNGYPLIVKEITINKVQSENGNHYVNVTIVTTKESEEHVIVLSSDFQIVKADIVNIQIANPHGQTNPDRNESANSSLPDYLEIPFRIDKNLIVTRAKLNGKEYDFIVDTGAPTITINSDLVELKNAGSVMSRGSTGATSLQNVMVSHFELGTLSLTDVKGRQTALSHISPNIAGLIGADVFSNYITVYDYKNLRIMLYKPESKETPKVLHGFVAINTVKLGHVPVIDVSVGGNVLKLIVDSGAAGLVLNPLGKTKAGGNVRLTGEKIDVKGVGSQVSSQEQAILSELNVGGLLIKDIPMHFSNQLHHHGSIEVDGIIGYHLLSRAVFAYDSKLGKMYLKL